MKKIIYFMLVAFLVSCSPINKELYDITDTFIESLQNSHESYGIFDSKKHIKTTESGQYQIMPVGRLINVKIMEAVDNEVYKELEEDLKSHYKDDERVNDVYINNAGTIMIDCRN